MRIDIKYDSDHVKGLIKRAGEYTLDPLTEDAIIDLMIVQREVNEAVEQMKAHIRQSMIEADPHLTSIKSDKLKVMRSPTGSKYAVRGTLKQVADDFKIKSVRYSIDPKAIEEYEAEHGALPNGIEPAKRGESMRIVELDDGNV